MSDANPSSWQDLFLDEFEKIDREQSPYGLYGLRQELGEGKYPASMRTAYAGENEATNIPKRLGWKTSNRNPEILWMVLPGEKTVHVRLASYASTKVRSYGDSYVLDRAHGKKMEESSDELETLVPRVAKDGSRDQPSGLLYIAHVPTPKRLPRLLGRTVEPGFLKRYGLKFFAREWEDRYNRGFTTAVWLWSYEPVRE